MANALNSIKFAFLLAAGILAANADAWSLDSQLEKKPIDSLTHNEARLFFVPSYFDADAQSAHLIKSFFIRQPSFDTSNTASTLAILFPGLFYPPRVTEMTIAYRCQLPTYSQARQWALENSVEHNSDLHGIYWLAPQSQHVGFASYIHLPTMRRVEYGNNIFQANLLMICNT